MNMNYCRAENTLLALKQILDDAEYEDGILGTFKESNREEKQAAVDLFAACVAYIEMFELAIEDDDYSEVFRTVPEGL